jgi:cobalamin biosynthetic protein CobC
LLALAKALFAKSGLLIVDEAFADLDPRSSIAARATGGLVSLRSFRKFYGLPGLRLGFALTDTDNASRISEALGPWPVSSLAINIGADALVDTEWQIETRQQLCQAAARLDGVLSFAGLNLVGGTDLYRLAEMEDALAHFEKLGRAGIYTRPFSEHPRWLRFGLPGTDAHWRRLELAMQS